MNTSAIRLLARLKDSPSGIKELKEALDLKRSQFYKILKDLIENDYVDQENGIIKLKLNAKTALLLKVSEKFNVVELLRDSNEDTIIRLTEPKTLKDLMKETGLSYRTLLRNVESLLAVGAIYQQNEHYLLKDDSDLYLFVKLLKEETEKRTVEPYAIVLYRDASNVLKRVPLEKPAKGTLTAFSLFSKYSVVYHPAHNYYIQPAKDLRLEEILIHSIVAADKENDRSAMTMAVIFYLIHREKMSLSTIRSIAREFKIPSLWLDVENYVRNIPLTNPEKFLPRKEFVEKAHLYGISPESYELPPAYPNLFSELGERVTRELTVFLFGGENMRMKKLKNLTKDCDLIVENKEDYMELKKTAIDMGYSELGKEYFSMDDRRINPSTILEHENRSRLDLFVGKIAGKLVLTKGMMERAERRKFGSITLGIMSNEDVFLLKAVTDREGDIQDMAKLAQTSGFDWKTVWKEFEYQEKITGQHFCFIFLDNIELLQKQFGIRALFYRKLQSLTLDHAIVKCVLKGAKNVSAIKSMIEDTPDYMIRNRVERLVSGKYLKKKHVGGNVTIEPGKRIYRMKGMGNKENPHSLEVG